MDTENPKDDARWTLDVRDADTSPVLLRFAGSWRLSAKIPDIEGFERELLRHPENKRLGFDVSQLTGWDTGLIVFLVKVFSICRTMGVEVDRGGLPEGARRLVDLAFAVPPKESGGRRDADPGVVARIGRISLDVAAAAPEMLRFLGELTVAFGRFLRGRARYRGVDLVLVIREVGPDALPIVSLISFLVGLILAYMGSIQLAKLGAEIYIADLVGIGMVREVGALMTGVIVAGRTGAAFAARLGTMQVNQEIDALKTMGISPMEFLVLPRVLALTLMMPLLTLYASLVGVLAGLFVSATTFDVGVYEYYVETVRALDLRQFAVGLAKGTVYGMLVAVAGCLRGLQCGRSAEAVGRAATSAVVTGILLIVIAGSVLTIMFQRLGI